MPLTVRQIHSMQSLQRHAPEMKEIQRKYKGDQQKQNEELMKFYKENKINPAASCLPLVAQCAGLHLALPRAEALLEAHPAGLRPLVAALRPEHHREGELELVRLRAARRVRRQPDLLDVLHVDRRWTRSQRRIMMFIPLIFITVIAHFPTGLVIYWVTTNLWTVGQGLVTRRLVPKTAPAAARPEAQLAHAAADERRGSATARPPSRRRSPSRRTRRPPSRAA